MTIHDTSLTSAMNYNGYRLALFCRKSIFYYCGFVSQSVSQSHSYHIYTVSNCQTCHSSKARFPFVRRIADQITDEMNREENTTTWWYNLFAAEWRSAAK